MGRADGLGKTTSGDLRQHAADVLLAAYGGWVIEPLSEQIAGLNLIEAYAIQLAQVQHWTRNGATIKGYKVRLSSPAMRFHLGIEQPGYGHLLDTMFYLEGSPVDLGVFNQPRIAPEIGLVLGLPLRGPGITSAEAAAAVQYVVPALEIVDSRIRNWRITLPDSIADNASAGGVVLGSHFSEPYDMNLRLIGCVLCRDGTVIDTGLGASVLGSPLNSLVWLANTVGRLGVTLEPGHIVLTGSLTAAHSIHDGDTFSAEFSSMGTVTATFRDDINA